MVGSYNVSRAERRSRTYFVQSCNQVFGFVHSLNSIVTRVMVCLYGYNDMADNSITATKGFSGLSTSPALLACLLP
jgi:hypothetical protein